MTMQRTITVPFKISLRQIVSAHGWVHLKPYEWNENRSRLTRSDMINGSLCKWHIQQSHKDKLTLRTDQHLSTSHFDEVAEIARYALMLDWDPVGAVDRAGQVNPKVANLIEEGAGRLLRGGCFFEDFCKTIFTINTSWANTVKMSETFTEVLGNGSFPRPIQILEMGVDKLQKEGRTGYRAKILYEATKHLLDSGTMDEEGNLLKGNIGREALLSIKGIGPYAADHLGVLQCDYSRIPVDSEVSSYCKKEFGIDGNKKDAINEYFHEWQEYRFLGYKFHRSLLHIGVKQAPSTSKHRTSTGGG